MPLLENSSDSSDLSDFSGLSDSSDSSDNEKRTLKISIQNDYSTDVRVCLKPRDYGDPLTTFKIARRKSHICYRTDVNGLYVTISDNNDNIITDNYEIIPCKSCKLTITSSGMVNFYKYG